MAKSQIGRRDFLRLGAGAAVAATIPACKKTPKSAIVVGSGFGGAIAAYRLTQAGISTTIIERGRRWTLENPPQAYQPFCTNLQPDGRSYWLRTSTASPVGPVLSINKYIGIVDRVDGIGMNVYRGAGYGGGSLVYGGVNLEPSQQRWSQTFPSEIDYAEMSSVFFPKVTQMTGVSTMPSDILTATPYLYCAAFAEAVANTSLTLVQMPTAFDWNAVRQELAGTIPASATGGQLMYGNNSGAKMSVDRNYLAQAEQTGLLQVQLQSLVRNVSAESGQRYSVDIEQLSETGEVVSTSTLSCDYLFLCAGSLGTTGILLQSKASGGLAKLDDQVGQNWGNNGDIMFSIGGYTASTGAVQGAPPPIAVDDIDNPITPTYVEVAPFPIGYDTQSTLHMSMAMTKTLGQIVLDDNGNPVAQYPQSGIDEAKAAMMPTIAPILSSNNLQMDTMFSSDGFIEGFTYHPVGGAAMNAVCDTYGRVQGYPGLYVVDGALLPGPSVGMNPALTIAALAERAMATIIAQDLKS